MEHYRDKELGETKNDWKTFSTKETYRGYIDKWILPRWGDSRLAEVKPGPVEEWLGSIQRSRGTRAKIRNIMSALFRHAMRHELFKRNPITLVRQSAKRAKVPDILEVEEVQTLLGALQPRERMLVLLAAGTGLRLGELLGLKWEDVDFGKLELNVTRSIVKQVVGFCKTEASQKPVPLDAYIAEELRLWKKEADFRAAGGLGLRQPAVARQAPLLGSDPDGPKARFSSEHSRRFSFSFETAPQLSTINGTPSQVLAKATRLDNRKAFQLYFRLEVVTTFSSFRFPELSQPI